MASTITDTHVYKALSHWSRAWVSFKSTCPLKTAVTVYLLHCQLHISMYVIIAQSISTLTV